MSNDELEKYKIEYSEFLEHIIRLHNHNVHFVTAPHIIHASRELRSILRDIRKSVNALKERSDLLYKEGLTNHREKRKEKIAYNKTHGYYYYKRKKPKNVNNQPNATSD